MRVFRLSGLWLLTVSSECKLCSQFFQLQLLPLHKNYCGMNVFCSDRHHGIGAMILYHFFAFHEYLCKCWLCLYLSRTVSTICMKSSVQFSSANFFPVLPSTHFCYDLWVI